MIITPNEDCTEILIQSSSFHANNVSNVLSITINAGDETQELTINANSTSYTLVPSDLGVTNFSAGVYEILLSSTLASTNLETDLGCTVLLCDYNCDEDRLALYADVTNIDKILAYEGLLNFNGCSTCNCTLANTLHAAYTNTPTINASNCGCQ